MDIALIAVRAVHFAATAMAAGAVFFSVLIAEPAFRKVSAERLPSTQAYRRQLAFILWIGLALAVLSGAAWLVLLAATITGQSLSDVISGGAAWLVLTKTHFGHVWTVRFACAILLANGLPSLNPGSGRNFRWRWLTAVCAAGLMGSLAWSGHAAGAPGSDGHIHRAADLLHLVAAAAWLGGLLPLGVLLARACGATDGKSARTARIATLRFSTLGLFSVGTLLATGIVNGWMLVGGLPALLETDYGKLLLAKIGLFIAMVCFAAINRLQLSPLLPDADATRRLRRNAIIEIGLGLIVIAIVGVLGTLPPVAHDDVHMHMH